ncbi:serine/threonine-protein kinase [Mycobacterium sp.]|uniref:serine/threonine-protein kinase n=1 Tax=Mycobacterium sp. TaxID=1785 RepID=UPI003BB13A51
MPLVIGATAAGFNIVRQLGYEEFGELYVAEHPRLPRQVVLHLIPAETSIDLDYRERFDQESDQAAALWHPNIAGLIDRGEFEDQLWLSTEYIDGADSAQLLGESHPDGMPPRMVIEIVSAIAEALDYAHDQGVVHRYVNPGNILVGKSPTDRKRIALTGFGVARPEGAHNTLTRAGMFIGTAGYTAPEQLLGDEFDGRVDQYALAASAFHLLTGSPPFAHFNPSVVVSKHLNERPPRPSDVRPDLTEFDAIFARALSQDPMDRYRRGRDFAKALESNGGTRSHIRATSELRAASIFREAGEPTDTAATTPVAAPKHIAAPKHTAAPKRIAAPKSDTVARPAAQRHAATAPPNGLPKNGSGNSGTSVSPKVPDDLIDDDDVDADGSAEARKRRLHHSAAIAAVVAVVLLTWFFGVKALRTASQSDENPTNVETSSAEPAVPMSATTVAPPALIAPPPPPPAAPPVVAPKPVVTTPAPVTTRPTTTKVVPRVTTTAPVNSPAQTPVPHLTQPTSTSANPPNGLDTRPAVGMPCGAEGSSAVSNSGGPVNCVRTPGGSAWEPPGG